MLKKLPKRSNMRLLFFKPASLSLRRASSVLRKTLSLGRLYELLIQLPICGSISLRLDLSATSFYLPLAMIRFSRRFR